MKRSLALWVTSVLLLFGGSQAFAQKTVTFLTKADAGDACSGNACGLLATNTDNSIKTGLVTIAPGLLLIVDGTITIGGIVTLDGSFTMQFNTSPFFLQITGTANIGLQGIGSLASVAVALQIDGDGLALYANISLGSLAGFAGKAVHEVGFHRQYAAGWVIRLGDGTEESHDRASAAVAELWPYTAELFAADELIEGLAAEGVAPDPVLLQARWSELVGAVLAEATLGVAPSATWRPGGGRVGLHTEALGYMLAEMQSVHRAYPGASW